MKYNSILLISLLSPMLLAMAENSFSEGVDNFEISKMTLGEEKIMTFKKIMETRHHVLGESAKTITGTREKQPMEMKACLPEKHPMLELWGIDAGSKVVLPPEKRARITPECLKDLPGNIQLVMFPGHDISEDFVSAGEEAGDTFYCYFPESKREYPSEYPPISNLTISIHYALSEYDARYALANEMMLPHKWTPSQFEENRDEIARAYDVRTDCEIGDSLFVFRSANTVGESICFIRDSIVFRVSASRTLAGKIDLDAVAEWLDSKYINLNRTTKREPTSAEIFTGRGCKCLYYPEVLDYVYLANTAPTTQSAPNITKVFERSKPPFDIHVAKVLETPANVEQNGWFLSNPGHHSRLINTYDFPCYEVNFASQSARLTLQITQCDSLRSARYVLFDTLVSTPYPRLKNGKFYMEPTSMGPPQPPFVVCREKAIGDDITLFYITTGRCVRFIRNNQVFLLTIDEDWRDNPSDFDFLAFAKWIDEQFSICEKS